ncbi:hypothetical protein V5N11_004838 [Cardamine amara subsp. amara]|uniref:Uncharacterized protein n=1 Tax=Cardamine amara subsp. amara TaxID=228776 RepID=A0ABD0ZDF5_CARAN
MESPGCSSDSGNLRQPSRLRKRPPALKIVPAPAPAPANSLETAIPLLSPLALSPKSPVEQKPPVENQTKAVAVEKTPVFKKWQHPAAPFYYESSTFVPPFVPV